MMKIPEANEFGGKGEFPAKLTQTEWLNTMKNNGCIGCHQLGQLSMRTFPKSVPHPIHMGTSEESWFRRIQSGQCGEQMFELWSSKSAARRFALFRRLDGPDR